MMLLAVWLLLFGGPADQTLTELPPPPLTMLSPTVGDTVPRPLRIQFTSAAAIESLPGGWGAAGYHLHASIDGTEVMPGPQDIRSERASYVWTIPGVPLGEVDVGLSWSDANHRALPETATSPVTIVVH
jgi:hypothetical protein